MSKIRFTPKPLLAALVLFLGVDGAQAENLLSLLLKPREVPAVTVQITGLSEQLLHDPNAPVLGNPNGDVTIIEFTDYNCGYCRQNAYEIKALLAEDPNVRVVIREWPIFGEDSELAALAALAARNQGKYDAFHTALMASGPASAQTILRAAKSAGLDIDQLDQDLEGDASMAHLERSGMMAMALGLRGTPSFIVGDQLSDGYNDRVDLADLVAEARARRKK